MLRKPKVISWDFDDTLVDSETGKVIEKNYNLFLKHKSQEDTLVVITTFRHNKASHLKDIIKLCPRTPIWATCGESKVDWLRWKKVNGWNIIEHYDDDKETIDGLNSETDIKGILIV